MSKKLVYLKTGEYIVTDLLEATDSVDRVVGYVFRNPKQILTETQWEGSQTDHGIQVKVSLITWPQFTKTTEVEIYPDTLVTVVDPTEELLKLYEDSLNG